MRELAVKRHLAAFKTGADGAAAAGRLALAAAAGGLAMAAAFAAADAFLAVHRAGDVLKFVEFHGRLEVEAGHCGRDRSAGGFKLWLRSA